MGTHKALLTWEGLPLLAYQLKQLSAVKDVAEIVVVTGYGAPRLAPIIDAAGPRVRAVHNAEFERGKTGSIRLGLDAIGDATDSILLLAVDQPRPADVLALLIEAHHRERALITRPVRHGRHGHPVIFSRSLLGELRAIDEQTFGVRAVIARHAAELCDVEVDDPVIHLDLNTPSDVADDDPDQ